MVGQKVGDPGGRELDRRVSKLPQQLTSDLHKLAGVDYAISIMECLICV